jgi:putative mRNA 3-end processing factor
MSSDLLQLSPAGLYCAAGDFHIDPWRPVPRAVITHAHSDHARSGSARYFAHRDSLPLLYWRLGEDSSIEGLGYGEEVAFGPVRVSLHPAGHVLGSAQVRIEHAGQVWVVSGDYKRDPDPTCAPFEVLACDTFITEATFALPVYRWRPAAEIAAEVLDWWDQCAARGETAVLGCYALGKAQRLLAELGALSNRRVLLHGAMLPAVEIYRSADVALPPTEAVNEQAKGADLAGQLVLAPPSALGTPWMRRFKRVSTGFASGWMQLRGNRRRRGFDRGFVLSDHADWPGLIDTVLATGARRVLATHGSTEVLVRYLRDRGVDAAALKTELGGEN